MFLDNINPAKKAYYIEQGRAFGSPVVKAQGQSVVSACKRYADVMARYGFTAQDAQDLEDYLALYPENLAARENKQVGRSLTSRNLKAQIKAAQQARLQSRAVLEVTLNRLRDLPNTKDTDEAIDLIQTLLNQTAIKPATTDAMLSQLRLLARGWSSRPAAEEAAKRGGTATLENLNAHIQALSDALQDTQQAAPTTAETQRLDLIDGLVLERVREANRIAKAAAKAEGDPALAAAFKLSHLYG